MKTLKNNISIICILFLSLLLMNCGETAESDTVTKKIQINSRLVDCEGVGTSKCMEIRESEDAEWSLFYDDIKGFQFEEGFLYELLVKVSVVENPPEDGASTVWELVRIISRTVVAGDGVFRIALSMEDGTGNSGSSFSQGELIRFVFSVENLTGESQEMQFASSQHYDIEVVDSAEDPVWRWSNGVSFIQVSQILTFLPNEIKTFEASWDQLADNGMVLTRGTYNAYGYILGESGGKVGPVEFTIR